MYGVFVHKGLIVLDIDHYMHVLLCMCKESCRSLHQIALQLLLKDVYKINATMWHKLAVHSTIKIVNCDNQV